MTSRQQQPISPKCRYCQSDILPDAVYCLKCNHFQSTRARIFDKLDTGTFVTLVPILTLSFAFVHDRLIFPYSDLTLLPVQCGLTQIDVAASNGGARAGIIKGGQVTQVMDGEDDKTFLLVPNLQERTIDPGKSAVLQLSVRINDQEMKPTSIPLAQRGKACRYNITMDIIQFGAQQPSQRNLECKCPGS